MNIRKIDNLGKLTDGAVLGSAELLCSPSDALLAAVTVSDGLSGQLKDNDKSNDGDDDLSRQRQRFPAHKQENGKLTVPANSWKNDTRRRTKLTEVVNERILVTISKQIHLKAPQTA